MDIGKEKGLVYSHFCIDDEAKCEIILPMVVFGQFKLKP